MVAVRDAGRVGARGAHVGGERPRPVARVTARARELGRALVRPEREVGPLFERAISDGHAAALGTLHATCSIVARRFALVFSFMVLPGALIALCVLLLARVIARTPRGRRVLSRARRRLPSWAAAPLDLLQGKNFSHAGEPGS